MPKTYKSFKLILVVIALSLFSAGIRAQTEKPETTLKGKITDETSGESIIGAVIFIKGTKSAVQTDENGSFELRTTKETPFLLTISYAGYKDKEIEIYEDDPNLELKLRSDNLLSEVVITAIGIESNRKSITSTVTEISGNVLKDAREPNIQTALSGKVAGVTIQNSGGSPGGASTIRIRGSNSLLGNNQPLYVLDGVPIDNATNQVASALTNTVSQPTASNRAIDINPNDIESITVLKGVSAAALYGLRAANGAIIVNTKRGSSTADKPFQASFSSSLTFENVNRRMQPRQTKYSNGTNGQYIAPGLSGAGANWGALIDTLTYSNLPSPYYAQGQIVGQSSPLSNGQKVEVYDNIKNFYVTGVTKDYNASISGRTINEEGLKASYYSSIGHLDQTGVVPTTNFYRTSVRFNGDIEPSAKLKISTGINFINSGSDNRAIQGGFPPNTIRALYASAVNFDITGGVKHPGLFGGNSSGPAYTPSAYLLPPTANKPWGAVRGYSGGQSFDSPYYSLNQNPNKDNVNRWIGFLQGDYKILSWLKATGRVGIDNYLDTRKSAIGRGAAGNSTNGILNDVSFSYRGINTDLVLTADRKLTEDLGLKVIAGHNFYSLRKDNYSKIGTNLLVNKLYDIGNAASVQASEYTYKKELVGVYATFAFEWKKWAFLNLTANNEWTSTFAPGHNSFFYPSVGAGVVLSDALNFKSNAISFAKIRGNYAQVGNDTDPYSLQTYYSNTTANPVLGNVFAGPFNGQSTLSYGNSLPTGQTGVVANKNLSPERLNSYEGGLELRFLKDRVGLDVTSYYTLSSHQIVPVSIAATTGFNSAIFNSGSVSNRGIEIALNVTPVETKDFTWDITGTFTRNVSRVEALGQNLSFLTIGTSPYAQSVGIVGQPYGVLYGTDFQRNKDGKLIIDDNPNSKNYGKPIGDATPKVLANPNPAFVAGLRNTITYKFVTLSVFFDTKVGFAICNSPKVQAIALDGTAKETEDRGVNKIQEGVKASNGEPNDIPITKDQNYYSLWSVYSGAGVEKNLYYLKLRDINLTFRLPTTLAKRVGASKISLTLTGRNFLLATNYTGSDPDLSVAAGYNNALGTDFWTTPNTRSWGASLNVSF